MAKSLELSLLEDIERNPTAPFFEHRISDEVLKIFRKHFKGGSNVSLLEDGHGNIILHYAGDPGKKKKALAYAVHMDHPAFRVVGMKDGNYILKMMGSLNTDFAVGSLVHLHTKRGKGAYAGIAKIVEAMDQGESNPARMYIAKPKGRADGKIAFATPVLKNSKFRGLNYEKNDILSSPAMDDLASVAMSIAALKNISEKKLPVDVYVVCHRAEEVGFIGAYAVATEKILPKDALVVSVETSSYLAKWDTEKKYRKIAKPGKGVIIRTGDKMTADFSQDVLHLLHGTALKSRKPMQEKRMFAGTCEASLYCALGYRSAGICLPLLGYHNNGALEGKKRYVPEGVNAKDFAGGVEFMVACAETLADEPRTYRRLGKPEVTPEQEKLAKKIGTAFRGYIKERLI